MSNFLVGARAIAAHLKQLGLIAEDDENAEDKVYHWAKTKRISTGRFGNQLISTAATLQRDAEKLVP
jgi:hypothetical protein